MKVDYAYADRYRFLTGILLDKTVLLCNVVGDLHACGVESELPRPPDRTGRDTRLPD
jgi:hypothetical protein